MRSKQSIEFWVWDDERAECLTLIESNGRHRLLRACYHAGAEGPYQTLGRADVTACSVLEFLELLSASIDRARCGRNRCEIYLPEPGFDALV